MLTEDEARSLTTEILALATADETRVGLYASRTTNLRFARSSPTTSGETDSMSITIESTFGKRSGSTTINQRDPAALETAVKLAEDIARRAPEDPETMPALPPQTYKTIPHAWDADTAERGAEALADGVALALAAAREHDLVAAGFVEVTASTVATASSTGNFGYHRATGAELSETFRTRDARGSGWGSSAATRIADLDFAGAAATAARKAAASASPKALAPGSYVTILEPAVVADLVGMMGYSLDGRSADEGRSFFSKKLGEQLFGKDITIRSDPFDPKLPGSPWAGEDLPEEPRDWVVEGKLANLAYGRYWADKKGVAPVPRPSNILMSGGTGTVDDLVASTERGVLITSVWYIRALDPRTLLFTGLTRDGVFWIENGAIAHAVNNFRWNDSPISVLKNVTGMSAPVHVLSRELRASNMIVPALRVSAFELSSVSDAV